MIGIISDTHDRLEKIERAVEIFNEIGVELVIHAGDFISPFTAKYFSRLNSKLVGVFGNNDGDKKTLKKRFDFAVLEDFIDFEYKGKKICVIHGDNEKLVNALVHSGIYDIVVTGHTHEPEIKKIEDVLLINPGEACGYLSERSTVIKFDPLTLEEEIIEL
ncbi:MAG: metallophosphoesterase [Candidatus Hydrothermarchaeota archaeon]